jgi:glycine betaine/choline ABC-type transport system substrate-binding protein
LSEVEVIILQASGVKAHESEAPPTVGLRAGAFAEVGTLILTNKRLLYISKGGASRAAAWAIGGVFAAQAVEKSVSKAEIDDLLKYEGSYFVSLQNITRAEAGKKLGQSFIRVDSTGSEKPVHAYVFADGGINHQWAAAINQAKASSQSTSTVQTVNYAPQQATIAASSQKICQRCGTPASPASKFCGSCGDAFAQPPQTDMPLPPPPTPPTQAATCPYCKSQIRYIQQYQRWYCDNEKRYV